MRKCRLLPILAVLLTPIVAQAADGNRLTYLDSSDPYYVGLDFPKLITPQWVGEDGVEAVVVLAIDDMTDNIPKYEAYLRPILNRLKQIDGRAPVSIMTCRVDPKDPHLQRWLAEGLNIDVHTLTHPCPLLQKGDFREAKRTFGACVDLLTQIPGNRPVAFRMPCCDSLNTPSPRFFAEIFNFPTPNGDFLEIDSSVFQLFTPGDPSLPRRLVQEADGRERFRKYIPFPSFVNTIENYPYPYILGRRCWEFPCIVPSDWEAQNLQKPNNPKTVEDLKAALDCVVAKQGVFNLVFHPHGWIRNEQVVELIDHAVATHGKKVKFLNFREALDRLNRNLLGGQPLRVTSALKSKSAEVDAAPDGADREQKARPPARINGADNGVRLLDLNGDGYLDVVIGNTEARQTRLWDPQGHAWRVSGFPTTIVDRHDERIEPPFASETLRFGIIRPGTVSLLAPGMARPGAWTFKGHDWVEDGALIHGIEIGGVRIGPKHGGTDFGMRLRDLDGDGHCELLVADNDVNAIFTFAVNRDSWVRLPFALPEGVRIVDATTRIENKDFVHEVGADAGLRFVDLDEDGRDDLVYSNSREYGIHLFDTSNTGWTRKLFAGRRTPEESLKPDAPLPPIVRTEDRTGAHNNGFWVHSRHLWWQNEDTDKLPNLVDRRSFNDLLKDVEPRGKTAEASRRSIRVRPGFKVELMASEPLVGDPIAFDWGADGKLWVVEMGDYPLGVDGKGKPGGVVKYLEDTNQDGKYDKATTFLEGLPFPTGVTPWRKGVLVACAPDIFYAEDTNGDGKADVRKVLFTGFSEGNQQHRLNGFDFGLDGWIYGANGDSNGSIRSLATAKTTNISGRDFRFRPDTGEFETESGQTQYGRHRDDWGNWYGNNNPNWAWLFVLSEHDLKRNPRFAPPEPKRMLEPDTRLYPVSRTVARFNDLWAANRTTSANSPTPYRDELFGPGFERSLFVSEPVHNLIHRVVVEPDGSTKRGRRAADEADREFLASSDNWFRPTMLRTGPDGALWIADMYRAVIEHPEWIPDDWEAKIDLRAGADQGRIYRVVPVDRKPRPIPRLDQLDTTGLAAALDSPNGWTRDTAQRLLLEQNDPAAIEPLRRIVAESARAKARVQAIWTLHLLGGLATEILAKSLRDADPEVRRNAVQVSASYLSKSDAVAQAALALAEDREPRVRLQLALSLGAWEDPAAGRALARIVRDAPDDPWIRAAVLSSAAPQATTILTALFGEAGSEKLPPALIEPLFATAAAIPGGRGLMPLVEALAAPKGSAGEFAPWQFSALAGILDSAERGQFRLDRDVLPRFDPLLADARRVVADDRAPQERRLLAVRVIGRSSPLPNADREGLAGLLNPHVPPALQRAAVTALARTNDPQAPRVLLQDWKARGPALRDAILDALLSRDAWRIALLDAIEGGRVPTADVDPAHRRILLSHRDPGVRKRAEGVFTVATAGRKEVLDHYRSALGTPGDARAGAEAFKRVCAACHRMRGVGTEVGPDLAALTDKSPEAVLIAVLDPNRAFESKYANFVVQTTDGRILTGMVATETANSVTLRRQEGQEDILLRGDIDEMASTGQSVMPDGLEKDVSPRDLANLIAYLGSSGPPRKVVDGNRPELVRPRDDRTILLRAANAEIYGETLTFETQYANLGYWSSPTDYAVWQLEVAQPGRYEVWLDRACADDSQGNHFVLATADGRLEGTVTGTGTWDDYKKVRVGEIRLPEGQQRLELRPHAPIRGALIDLRAIELRPIKD
jgi:putative membrane-bound dehydrogenase-like protein